MEHGVKSAGGRVEPAHEAREPPTPQASVPPIGLNLRIAPNEIP